MIYVIGGCALALAIAFFFLWRAMRRPNVEREAAVRVYEREKARAQETRETERSAIEARHSAAIESADRERATARTRTRTQRAGALVAAAAAVRANPDECPNPSCKHWRHVGRCDDCACEGA